MPVKFSGRWLLLAFVLLGIAVSWPARSLLIGIDRQYFGESLRGLYGRYVAGEEWDEVVQIPTGLSYAWLYSGARPLRIGHALGGAGSMLANDIAALPDARRSGIKILEVDLWLHRDGTLRCFHGPGDPGPLLPQTCTFGRLLRETETTGEYLVLDIKTEFASAARLIATELRALPSARGRIIFQLYRPSDFQIFRSLDGVQDMAGPIVTAYVSRSSLASIADGASKAGVMAMALPVDRLPAMGTPPTGMRLLLHPVHDCRTLALAIQAHMYGVYVPAGLACKD